MIYLILFFVLVVSFMLTWIVRIIAIRRSILDIPNHRSSHTIPTPRGGGLAVAVSWFAGLSFFYKCGIIELNFFYALLSGLPLIIIGFIDDLFNIKPLSRFVVQFICAAMAVYFLGGFQNLQVATVNLKHIYVLTPIAFIAIVWSVNLFNFLDGIDGYIGTEIVFIGLALYLLSGYYTGLLLAMATTGFLIWNWPRAKIFMGDAGSTLLGFTVAVFAIYYQNNFTLSISVWLILTSVFWFDATVTIIRRLLNKEYLAVAHRKHAFQRIVQSGFSHGKTTLWALGLNIFGFTLAILAKGLPEFDYLFLLTDLIILSLIMFRIDKKNPF